jgi:hypothetical protein
LARPHQERIEYNAARLPGVRTCDPGPAKCPYKRYIPPQRSWSGVQHCLIDVSQGEDLPAQEPQAPAAAATE